MAEGQYRPNFLAAIELCLTLRHTDRPRSVTDLRLLLLPRPAQEILPPMERPGQAKPPSTPRARRSAETTAKAVSPKAKPIAAIGSLIARRWLTIGAVAVVLGGLYGGFKYDEQWRQKEAQRRVEEEGARERAEQQRRAEAEALRKLQEDGRRKAKADEVLAQAAQRIERGDVIGAREVLAGAEPTGPILFALAETYDPNMLAAWATPPGKVDANVSRARAFYGQALDLGVARARSRLQALQ
jgi:hypothetical protein